MHLQQYSSNKKHPVFVFVSNTGTVLNRAIGKVTKDPYNHSSITFDVSLNQMYSFGRKYTNTPFIGTFVIEDINNGLFLKLKNQVTYALYVTFVSTEERKEMIKQLNTFRNNASELKYNFTGLFKHMVGVKSERKNAFFCSEFVATLFKNSGNNVFSKHPSLVKPFDVSRNKQFFYVCSGKLKEYNSVKARSKTIEIFQNLKAGIIEENSNDIESFDILDTLFDV